MPRKQRRSTNARGYGVVHQKTRKRWAPLVAAGDVKCARCGQLIRPGEPWDLDHADDRKGYIGPSHAACNRAAEGVSPPRLSRYGSPSLESRVPEGCVRCGMCGWILEVDDEWQSGVYGPEHVTCENEPLAGGPPYMVRIWSRIW